MVAALCELQNLNLGGELDLNGLENATEEHAKAASLGNKENSVNCTSVS